MDLEDFGRQLRGHVLSGTGLTIGVGFGATKTLAKSAQWASKEWPQFSGVLALSPENPRRTAKLLSLQPVEEIWGVGNRIAKKLHVMGITTAPAAVADEPHIYPEKLQRSAGAHGT